MTSILPFRARRETLPNFETLVRPHLDLLYRLAYRFCANQADAEDLVQDLLVKLYPRRAEMATIDNLQPWLTTSLYRLFVDGTRRRARSRLDLIDDEAAFYDSVASEEDQPDEDLQREQRLSQLQRAFERLNDDHRALLSLHDIEGYQLNEISEMLEVPIGTLKSRIHRGRARLRELLQDMEGTL